MRLHHVGVVVPSITDALAHYRTALNLEPTGSPVYDPHQDARVVMLADAADGPGLELIEPGSPTSPVARQAERGGGLAHTCYEAADLEAELARLRAAGAMPVRAPAPAVLFGGRRVAFVFLRTRHLIELLEAP